MKAFFLWASIFIALYAGLGAGSHLLRSAAGEKILIAVDVSGALEEAKHRLPQALAFLEGRRYASYKIVTNSSNKTLRALQDWSPRPDYAAVARIAMYAPLDLGTLLKFEELKSADLVVFVTNAADTGLLEGVPNSQIVRVR